MKIDIKIANPTHIGYSEEISELMEVAAKQRGTGISKRAPELIAQKMHEGKAVIALMGDKLAGFCYIEPWTNGSYVSHSGLIVAPEARGQGVARKVKRRAFQLSQELYPGAKIFGITTSPAVLKINSDFGYKPVPFVELTKDESFWEGCESCVNHDILTRTARKNCLCTGMLYDPAKENKTKTKFYKLFARFQRLKTDVLFKRFQKNKPQPEGNDPKEELKIDAVSKESISRKEMEKIYF